MHTWSTPYLRYHWSIMSAGSTPSREADTFVEFVSLLDTVILREHRLRMAVWYASLLKVFLPLCLKIIPENTLCKVIMVSSSIYACCDVFIQRRPKGPYNLLPPLSTYYVKNSKLVESIKYLLWVKFRHIAYSSCREEVENV